MTWHMAFFFSEDRICREFGLKMMREKKHLLHNARYLGGCIFYCCGIWASQFHRDP